MIRQPESAGKRVSNGEGASRYMARKSAMQGRDSRGRDWEQILAAAPSLKALVHGLFADGLAKLAG